MSQEDEMPGLREWILNGSESNEQFTVIDRREHTVTYLSVRAPGGKIVELSAESTDGPDAEPPPEPHLRMRVT